MIKDGKKSLDIMKKKESYRIGGEDTIISLITNI